LHYIEANKLGLSPVFGSWEWREYYKNKMCTVALENSNLWITIRIPQVKKAERLVRAIPSPVINEVIAKINGYGLVASLFKEKNYEKYHVMTQSSLELCNILGNTRTCGVREAKFTPSSDVIIPIEFALNRFLIVGSKPVAVKVMSKCPSGIEEYTIAVDSVWLVPNNCSYSSAYLSIETREADVEITKQIGIVHFEKFEVSPVTSRHLNSSILVEEVLNSSSSKTFERNRNEIKTSLDSIRMDHTDFLSTYSLEKWILISSLLFIMSCIVVVKAYFLIKKRRVVSTQYDREIRDSMQMQQLRTRDIEIETSDSRTFQQQQQQQQLQQTQTQQQFNDPLQITVETKQVHKNAETMRPKSHVYSEIAGGNVSFSSKPEHSQFFK